MDDKQVPMAGLAAAFIFAVQMLNFPVANGTSGHLLGGVLAAVLVGPWVGALCVSVVLVVQGLLFADGGLSALGLNVINMALVGAWGGYVLFVLVRKFLPRTKAAVVGAAGVAAGLAPVLASIAFTFEYAIGGNGAASVATVAAAMVGVHVLIGIGEGDHHRPGRRAPSWRCGPTSSTGPATCVARRRAGSGRGPPPARRGADDAEADHRSASSSARAWSSPLLLAFFVSPFASSAPDGLEKVAADKGLDTGEQAHALADGPLADYAVKGVDNEKLSTGLAGVIGVAVTFAVGLGLFVVLKKVRRPDDTDEATAAPVAVAPSGP